MKMTPFEAIVMFGQKAKRRSRHIKSQMKYFGSNRFKWDYARNKKRDFRSF